MQVRSAARPITVRPAAVAAKPAVKAAVEPAQAKATKPAQAAKPKADDGFGSDMLQHLAFGLANVGAVAKLPGALSKLAQLVPKQALGMLNVAMGGWNAYKDIQGLKNPANTKKGDDYLRLGGDAAMIAGGAAMLAGALVAPWLPLAGAGVAAAGYLARSAGIWRDETRW